MMTFADIQSATIRRFRSGLANDVREWIRTVYSLIWDLEDWTFKHTTALVTVTSGSQTVTGLPADLGIPHHLFDQYGNRVEYLPHDQFLGNYYDSTGTYTGQPCHWTDIGDLPEHNLSVGPTADTTSAAFKLLYERACGYYPSTTLGATAALPTGTVTVVSTAAFPSSGDVLIGGRKVTYTGKTSTTLTGCTGGTGSFASGETVVSLTATAGQLAADGDVPLLPGDTHMILVHAAQAIGRTLESDITGSLQDDRVAQMLDGMRRRYLNQERGSTEQYGDGHQGW